MKFLADAMLGKLARFLRIFGYDVVYANDLEDHFQISPVPDDKLLEYAKENERIILTKDLPFHKIARDISIFLEGEGTYYYLNQLKNEYNLEYNVIMENTRCSVCNSPLKCVKDKNLIKDYVKPETYKYFDEFYQCINPKCEKVYWKGTHIKDILKRLKNNLKIS